MAKTAQRRHGAGDEAAQPGRATPADGAVVRERLRERHADPRADRGGKADQERRPIVMGGESRGEERRQRRDRAVHQPGETGLDILQNEIALLPCVFLLALGGVQIFVLDVGRDGFVALFDLGEIGEQCPDGRVLRLRRGLDVEIVGFGFAEIDFRADLRERQIADEPDRPPLHETADIGPPDRQEIRAKFVVIGLQQRVAVRRFDIGHVGKYFRRGRITFAQILGERRIDPVVVVLGIDSQGKDFALAELRELFHDRSIF